MTPDQLDPDIVNAVRNGVFSEDMLMSLKPGEAIAVAALQRDIARRSDQTALHSSVPVFSPEFGIRVSKPTIVGSK